MVPNTNFPSTPEAKAPKEELHQASSQRCPYKAGGAGDRGPGKQCAPGGSGRDCPEVEGAEEKEKTNTVLIKHSASKSERYAQRARKGEMEFLEENKIAHLLSLINIEMKPLRGRHRLRPREKRGWGKLPEPQESFVPADLSCQDRQLFPRGLPEASASGEGVSLCPSMAEQQAG